MTYTTPAGPPLFPPPPKPKKRHTALIITGSVLGGVTVLIVAAAAIGAAAGGGHKQQHHATTVAQPATSAPPAPAAPNPDGTYRGSCDYLLPNNFPGTYRVIGEVDLHNTGNIGTVVKVKITWPQEGYGPIRMTRSVRTLPGDHSVVRFRKVVSSNQIDLLQSWQEHHGMRDGCTYKASMVKTFGSVQS